MIDGTALQKLFYLKVMTTIQNLSFIGYLPYAKRDEYQALAKTWKQLSAVFNLPGAVLFDPLVRLSSLHMLIYMLRRAAEEIGSETGRTEIRTRNCGSQEKRFCVRFPLRAFRQITCRRYDAVRAYR